MTGFGHSGNPRNPMKLPCAGAMHGFRAGRTTSSDCNIKQITQTSLEQSARRAPRRGPAARGGRAPVRLGGQADVGDVALGPDHAARGRDHFLAQRVQRRVGHLRATRASLTLTLTTAINALRTYQHFCTALQVSLHGSLTSQPAVCAAFRVESARKASGAGLWSPAWPTHPIASGCTLEQ